MLAENLHADETVMQVMNEPGRKNTTKSYMWVYGTYKDSKHQSGFLNINLLEVVKMPESFYRDSKDTRIRCVPRI